MDLAECAKRQVAPIRINIEEICEGLGCFDDIADGNGSSYLLITDANGLNPLGADLISWVYAKDKKAGMTTTLNASLMKTNMFASTLPKGSQGVSVGSIRMPGRQSGKATLHDLVAMLPDMLVHDGKFGLALNPAMARLQLGFGDEKAGVATTLTKMATGLLTLHSSAGAGRSFHSRRPVLNLARNLQAGGGVKLGNVQVGVYGSFDTLRRVNTFNFGISPVPGVVFGYGNSGKYHVINASANLLGGKVLVDSSANIAPEDLDLALRVICHAGQSSCVWLI